MSLKSFFLLLGLAATTISYAQDSDKFITQSSQEGYTLYFIRPTEFKADRVKAKMSPDFTFEYQKGQPEAVDMRFSIFSKFPIRAADSIAFYRAGELIGRIEGVETMFLEKSKRKWHSRFETTLPYSLLIETLEAGDAFSVKVYHGESTMAFPAGKDWAEASEIIPEILAVGIK